MQRFSNRGFAIVILSLAIGALAMGQQDKSRGEPAAYDSVLAKQLGADQYGMRQYVMAFLVEGKTRIADSAKAEALQSAHLKNIFRLADEGKIALAGPFLDSGNVRGIFILNVTSMKEAKDLVNSDPAVQAGVLEMELRPWYGSAALLKVMELHKKIERVRVGG